MSRGNPDFFGQAVTEMPGSLVVAAGQESIPNDETFYDIFRVVGKIEILELALICVTTPPVFALGLNFDIDAEEVPAQFILYPTPVYSGRNHNTFMKMVSYHPSTNYAIFKINNTLKVNGIFGMQATNAGSNAISLEYSMIYRVLE